MHQIGRIANIVLIAIVVGHLSSCEQNQPQTESPVELIQQSLNNIGDLADENLNISLQVICSEGINRGQSYHAAGEPYNIYQVETHFQIDRPNNREIAMSRNPFNGFVFQSMTLVEDGVGKTYDSLSNTSFVATGSGFNNYRHFPHRYLEAALRDSAKLVYDGLIDLDGSPVHVITINNERTTKLYFDKETLFLKKLEQQVVNQPYGNGISVKEWDDYQQFEKIMLPQQIKSGGIYDSWGTLFNSYNVQLLNEAIPLPELASFRFLEGDFPPASWVNLADNLFMLRNVNDDKLGIGDYNVLAAEFEDFILVGEAPVSNEASRKVIDKVTEEFPDKPIKYMVQSHHHSDHVAGMREYIATQVELVIPSSIQVLTDKIAKADWSYQPDNQHTQPQQTQYVLVEGSHQIADQLNEAQIVNIGPIPHVNDMLAIYFPKQKLLWQVDMISFGEWPLTIEPSVILKERIAENNWDVEIIAGEHGGVMQIADVKDYLNN